MPGKKDRVIIDTNLWISFLLTSDYSSLDFILINSKVVLIFSEGLLKEFIEVENRKQQNGAIRMN